MQDRKKSGKTDVKRDTDRNWLEHWDTVSFRVMFSLIYLHLLGYHIVLFPHYVFNQDLHNACYLWHLNYKPQAANRSKDKIDAWKAGVQRESGS